MSSNDALQDADSSFKRGLRTFCIAATLISLAITSVYFWHFHGGFSDKHSTWAELGDFIGGTVGTAISLCAFLALVMTLRLQSQALSVSQQEMRKTSSAAETQARHFTNQAEVDDIVASIRELEREIEKRGNDKLIAQDERGVGDCTVPLSVFTKRNTEYVSFLSVGNVSNHQVPLQGNRHSEIGKLFKLLFEQIIALRNYEAATNRYRIFMRKHLETFYYLERIKAMPIDWLAQIDEESQSLLGMYSDEIRNLEIQRTHTKREK